MVIAVPGFVAQWIERSPPKGKAVRSTRTKDTIGGRMKILCSLGTVASASFILELFYCI